MPVLLLLFVGSGAAALIYEIVWLQLLQLVIGSSAVSVGVLLGTFMGGMCLGQLAAAARGVAGAAPPARVRCPRAWHRDLWSSAAARHAACGRSVHRLGGRRRVELRASRNCRGHLSAPADARDGRDASGGGKVGRGDPRGRVVARILLRREHCRRRVRLSAGRLLPAARLRHADRDVCRARSQHCRGRDGVGRLRRERPRGGKGRTGQDGQERQDGQGRSYEDRSGPSSLSRPSSPVYLAIALSGFCALAGEVVWTRLLGLLFGATVYTFSIILAVFLIGLGIGSTAGAALSRNLSRPRVAFGWCQLLVVAAIAWASRTITQSLPYWPVSPTLNSDVRLMFEFDFVRALWALLPAAILWGASFPLALASVASKDQDPGRLVGRVYAANTIGAVLGALLASLLLVAWIGSQHAEQVMMGASLFAAVLILTSVYHSAATAARDAWLRRHGRRDVRLVHSHRSACAGHSHRVRPLRRDGPRSGGRHHLRRAKD